MALLKSSEAETPRRYKFGGQNIQQSGQGLALRKANKTRITRTPFQKSSAGILLFMSRAWKTLDSSHVAAWSAFVAAYPQSLRRKIVGSLSGYQNFIKRNYFVWLKNGVDFPLMFVPEMVEYASDSALCGVINDSGTLKLNLTFERSSGDLDTFIFVSYPTSPGKKFVATQSHFMCCVPSIDAEIDIKDLYINKFGILPQVGQSVCVSIVQTGKDNGQFWFPDRSVVTVIEPVPPVPIDYLFASSPIGGVPLYLPSISKYADEYQGFVFTGGRIVNLRITLNATPSSNFDLYISVHTNVANVPSVKVGECLTSFVHVSAGFGTRNIPFDLTLPAGDYYFAFKASAVNPSVDVGTSNIIIGTAASDNKRGMVQFVTPSFYQFPTYRIAGLFQYFE